MQEIIELFSYSFFKNAVLAAFLSSLVCGIIGTYIVSRRIVFISGSITHASFGGLGIGYYFGFDPILSALLFSVVLAFILEFLSKTKLRKDSLIGMIWSFGMAIGIIFIFKTEGFAPNLLVFLFGNILTVSNQDILYLFIISILVISFFTLFFKTILYLSFDEQHLKTLHINSSFFSYILIALVAASIVINIKLVGIILVLSMLTIPQAISELFFKSFRKIMIFSVIFCFFSNFIGLIVSYKLDIPSGATIILTLIILYIISFLLKKVFSKF